jgi:hypothetical protein
MRKSNRFRYLVSEGCAPIIEVCVSPEIIETIEAEATRRSVKLSAVARLALAEFAAKLGAAEAPKREAA